MSSVIAIVGKFFFKATFLQVTFFCRHMYLNSHIYTRSRDVRLSHYDLKSCTNTYYINNDNP